MERLTIQAPSRLHFGLLSWGNAAPRQFGGVGLMVAEPGLTMSAEPAESWSVTGPLRQRVLAVVAHVLDQLAPHGVQVVPLRFAVESAPPEHVGLGLGTQTGMAVARLISEAAGLPNLAAPELARLAGRGLRSGIGLHGFVHGGLLVDGGRSPQGTAAAPLLARLDWPPDWSILVVIPPDLTGLHGVPEVQAFSQLPPLAQATVDQLCRLVLLDLLPAVAETNLAAFGAALAEIQFLVGQGFAPAQGGIYARPDLADLVAELQSEGLVGVGQSSWGPTLYGFSAAPGAERAEILARLQARTGWPDRAAFWTSASRSGAQMTRFRSGG